MYVFRSTTEVVIIHIKGLYGYSQKKGLYGCKIGKFSCEPGYHSFGAKQRRELATKENNCK